MTLITQPRTASTTTSPSTIRQAPPMLARLLPADNPNRIAAAISLLGSENPSSAQRNGRTSWSVTDLKILVILYIVQCLSPHHLNILILVENCIQLESWSNSQGEPKLRHNINIELVLLLVWSEARYGREKGRVCLVKVRV